MAPDAARAVGHAQVPAVDGEADPRRVAEDHDEATPGREAAALARPDPATKLPGAISQNVDENLALMIAAPFALDPLRVRIAGNIDRIGSSRRPHSSGSC